MRSLTLVRVEVFMHCDSNFAHTFEMTQREHNKKYGYQETWSAENAWQEDSDRQFINGDDQVITSLNKNYRKGKSLR